MTERSTEVVLRNLKNKQASKPGLRQLQQTQFPDPSRLSRLMFHDVSQIVNSTTVENSLATVIRVLLVAFLLSIIQRLMLKRKTASCFSRFNCYFQTVSHYLSWKTLLKRRTSIKSSCTRKHSRFAYATQPFQCFV